MLIDSTQLLAQNYAIGWGIVAGCVFAAFFVVVVPSFRRSRPETEEEREKRLREEKRKRD